jgi:hypothetical protein
MKAIFSYFRSFLAVFASFYPQKLPNGREEFERFAIRIIKTFHLPDNDSFRNMIAGMIQHAPQTTARLSAHYFGCRIRKAVANEVAFYVMQDLKEKKQTKAEVTAPPQATEAVTHVPPQETPQLQGT